MIPAMTVLQEQDSFLLCLKPFYIDCETSSMITTAVAAVDVVRARAVWAGATWE